MRRPALVTGATGLIGRALVERESERPIVALSRSGRPSWAEGMDNVEWVEADLADPAFADALPTEIGAVVHLARSRRHREFPDSADDIYAIDLASTAHLLEYARHSGAERFVLASTATVYAPGPAPLAEDAPLAPGRMFAACKRGSELLLQSYAGEVPGIALRLFTAYGPGQSGALIPDLIERARSGDTISVQGDRGLLTSPVLADDVATALAAALDAELPSGAPEVVNIGGPDDLGIREIGEAIHAELGTRPRFQDLEGPEPGGYLADNSKARELLGWRAPTPFAEGLRSVLSDAGAL